MLVHDGAEASPNLDRLHAARVAQLGGTNKKGKPPCAGDMRAPRAKPLNERIFVPMLTAPTANEYAAQPLFFHEIRRKNLRPSALVRSAFILRYVWAGTHRRNMKEVGSEHHGDYHGHNDASIADRE